MSPDNITNDKKQFITSLIPVSDINSNTINYAVGETNTDMFQISLNDFEHPGFQFCMLKNISGRLRGGGCSKFDCFVNIHPKLKLKNSDDKDLYCHLDVLMSYQLSYSSLKIYLKFLRTRKKDKHSLCDL